jgi:hypothetical protein
MRFGRGTTIAFALVTSAIGLIAAAPGYASTSPCPWSDQSSPCPVKRSTAFTFWGKADDATPGTSLSIATDGFARIAKVAGRLTAEAGDDEDVEVKSTTRYYVVQHGTQKSRIGATAFWELVDNYDDATLYVTGKLAAGSYWDDDSPSVNASIVTIDLSELPSPPVNLSGGWTVDGIAGSLTATDASDLVYNGTQGAARYTLTVNGSTACVTNYSYAPVPNNATVFQCGPISTDTHTIGPIPWTSPVWGSGTWTLTR